MQDGIEIFVGGHDEDSDDDAVDCWVAAAKSATGRLASTQQTLDWTCLVGPPPMRVIGGERGLVLRR